MYRNRLIVAAIATALAAPVAIARPAAVEVPPAATGAAATASVAQTAELGRAKRYCIREALTGTRIKRNYCKTRDQWLLQGFDPVAKF